MGGGRGRGVGATTTRTGENAHKKRREGGASGAKLEGAALFSFFFSARARKKKRGGERRRLSPLSPPARPGSAPHTCHRDGPTRTFSVVPSPGNRDCLASRRSLTKRGKKNTGKMGAPSMPAASAATTPLARAAALAYGTAGIYAAYLTQGIVQEKLATRRYGPAGDRFPGLDALHGVQVRGKRERAREGRASPSLRVEFCFVQPPPPRRRRRRPPRAHSLTHTHKHTPALHPHPSLSRPSPASCGRAPSSWPRPP